jgi:hypothetical protein
MLIAQGYTTSRIVPYVRRGHGKAAHLQPRAKRYHASLRRIRMRTEAVVRDWSEYW